MKIKILTITFITLCISNIFAINKSTNSEPEHCKTVPGPIHAIIDWSRCAKISEDLKETNLQNAIAIGAYFGSSYEFLPRVCLSSPCNGDIYAFARINRRSGYSNPTTLERANLAGAKLTEAVFNGTNLSSADLTGANLTKARFGKGVRWIKLGLHWRFNIGPYAGDGWYRVTDGDSVHVNVDTNLRGAILVNANLTDAIIDGDLTGADLTGSNLMNLKLTGVGANLTNVNFSEAVNLGKDIFVGTTISGKTLDNVDVSGLNFQGTKISGINDLSKVKNLNKIKLHGATLSRVNFVGLVLRGVSFKGATIQEGVFFGNSDMRGMCWTDGTECSENSGLGSCLRTQDPCE
jgi:Uncharacterized low-complexity proteins